jgi:hypothetical protein
MVSCFGRDPADCLRELRMRPARLGDDRGELDVAASGIDITPYAVILETFATTGLWAEPVR